MPKPKLKRERRAAAASAAHPIDARLATFVLERFPFAAGAAATAFASLAADLSRPGGIDVQCVERASDPVVIARHEGKAKNATTCAKA